MKKICYLLCMICTLGVFNACSDDDDDAVSSMPVTEIVVPAKVQAGSELIIAGNGFATDCKVVLKNEAQSIELKLSEQLSASVSFSVPANVAVGEYTVVLVQSGEWPLRKITVLSPGAGPDSPVSALVFPSGAVTAGDEVSIQGLGFAKDCEISLQSGSELLKMAVTASNSGVRFTVPGTLSAGTYPVVLKQDGGQWTLGEITVETGAVVPSGPQIAKMIMNGGETESRYSYDDQGRISAIESYDLSGGTEEPMKRVTFTWTEGLAVQTYRYREGTWQEKDLYEYTLEDGKAVSGNSGAYAYDSEGYLITTEDGYNHYEYNENSISSWWNEMDFGDGNPMRTECTFSYDEGVAAKNISGVDLMAEILSACQTENTELYYARIAGVCGKAPELLPSSASMDYDDGYDPEVTPMIYTVDGSERITRITYNVYGEDMTIEITYK